MTATPTDKPKISKQAAALVQDLMAAEAGAQIRYGSTDQGLRRELRELAWDIYQPGTCFWCKSAMRRMALTM